MTLVMTRLSTFGEEQLLRKLCGKDSQHGSVECTGRPLLLLHKVCYLGSWNPDQLVRARRGALRRIDLVNSPIIIQFGVCAIMSPDFVWFGFVIPEITRIETRVAEPSKRTRRANVGCDVNQRLKS